MTERARAKENIRKRSGKQWTLVAASAVVAFAVFFWGIGYLVETFTTESTDDAFLEGHVVAIAPKVAGLVSAVFVTHNQAVNKGDLLFEIDPSDLQVTLDQKEAALASAQANQKLVQVSFALMRTRVATAEAAARQAEADVAAAQAAADRAQAEFKRDQDLLRQNILSQQEYDVARAATLSADAALKSAKEKALTETSRVKEAQEQLEAARSAFDQAKAQVGSAQAEVQAAKLNLSYTKVNAPQAGVIARKNVEPGSYVQVGQQLLALVPNDLWVVANFKETQLADVRPGLPARVEIDSVPNRMFKAHVDSVQPGSGARFSLLPPENAVGNFVKVVQRVPVKLAFDEPLETTHRVGPGMSVQPAVITSTFSLPVWARGAIALFLAVVLAGVLLWIFRPSKEPEEKSQ